MEPVSGREEVGLMSDRSPNSAGSKIHHKHENVNYCVARELNRSCDRSGAQQVSDWCPALLQQQQYHRLTSRGRSDPAHTQGGSSVHPLVPLLLYSDTHLPPVSPYRQPISEPAADAPVWTRPCYHDSSVTSRQLVKKPLNAFMLYMKEMRHKVQQEGRERESAAINRILGRQWHALSRSEQSRYYDLAQKERLLHMQLHPGWSARDNYGKRKRSRTSSSQEVLPAGL